MTTEVDPLDEIEEVKESGGRSHFSLPNVDGANDSSSDGEGTRLAKSKQKCRTYKPLTFRSGKSNKLKKITTTRSDLSSLAAEAGAGQSSAMEITAGGPVFHGPVTSVSHVDSPPMDSADQRKDPAIQIAMAGSSARFVSKEPCSRLVASSIDAQVVMNPLLQDTISTEKRVRNKVVMNSCKVRLLSLAMEIESYESKFGRKLRLAPELRPSYDGLAAHTEETSRRKRSTANIKHRAETLATLPTPEQVIQVLGDSINCSENNILTSVPSEASPVDCPQRSAPDNGAPPTGIQRPNFIIEERDMFNEEFGVSESTSSSWKYFHSSFEANDFDAASSHDDKTELNSDRRKCSNKNSDGDCDIFETSNKSLVDLFDDSVVLTTSQRNVTTLLNEDVIEKTFNLSSLETREDGMECLKITCSPKFLVVGPEIDGDVLGTTFNLDSQETNEDVMECLKTTCSPKVLGACSPNENTSQRGEELQNEPPLLEPDLFERTHFESMLRSSFPERRISQNSYSAEIPSKNHQLDQPNRANEELSRFDEPDIFSLSTSSPRQNAITGGRATIDCTSQIPGTHFRKEPPIQENNRALSEEQDMFERSYSCSSTQSNAIGETNMEIICQTKISGIVLQPEETNNESANTLGRSLSGEQDIFEGLDSAGCSAQVTIIQNKLLGTPVEMAEKDDKVFQSNHDDQDLFEKSCSDSPLTNLIPEENVQLTSALVSAGCSAQVTIIHKECLDTPIEMAACEFQSNRNDQDLFEKSCSSSPRTNLIPEVQVQLSSAQVTITRKEVLGMPIEIPACIFKSNSDNQDLFGKSCSSSPPNYLIPEEHGHLASLDQVSETSFQPGQASQVDQDISTHSLSEQHDIFDKTFSSSMEECANEDAQHIFDVSVETIGPSVHTSVVNEKKTEDLLTYVPTNDPPTKDHVISAMKDLALTKNPVAHWEDDTFVRSLPHFGGFDYSVITFLLLFMFI